MSKTKKSSGNGNGSKPAKSAKPTTTAKVVTNDKSADADRVAISELDKQKRAEAKPPKRAAKAAKPPTSPKPVKEKKLSCLDAAAKVLAAEGKPMNCKAMINAMHNGKLWTSDAPTPTATLYSAILREMTSEGSAARFKKVDRGEFALSGK